VKVLSIVESAYRATLEEQDDTIVWLTHAMKGAGADLSLLLRGNSVGYAVEGQDASGLSFGGMAQTQPPELAQDVAKLIEKGVDVYIVDEDLEDRGIGKGSLIAGLKPVPRDRIAALFGEFDQVWHW
jgi:hypothetical protein